MVTKCRDDEIGIKLLQIFRQMVNNDYMRDKVVHIIKKYFNFIFLFFILNQMTLTNLVFLILFLIIIL